jgi:hypothetical protein
MNTVSHFWGLILATVIALLPLINPFAAAPTFLAITEGDTPARRNQQLRMACIYMVAILISFLIGGTFIMGFFGISIPGLRIAGGLLVAGIGSGMLVAGPKDANQTKQEQEAARAKRDIAFSPLAMPMLSGHWNPDRRDHHLCNPETFRKNRDRDWTGRDERPHQSDGIPDPLCRHSIHRQWGDRNRHRSRIATPNP